jgi:hypothetical protein
MYLETISFNNISYTFPQPIPFAPNAARLVVVTVDGLLCERGDIFQLENLTLTYTEGGLTGLRQIGALPFVGRCS